MSSTILLVDDEKSILDGLGVLIRRYIPECQVVAKACSGLQGYKLALELKPEIVITDVRMFDIDGLKMIDMLKNHNSESDFVIISAYSDFEYARMGMKLGVKYYLTKPIEDRELKASIADILARRMDRTRQPMDSIPPAFREGDLIGRIKAYIRDNSCKGISLTDLSGRFSVNPSYLSQLFKEKTGENYLDYLTKVRVGQAKELLHMTDLKVCDICRAVGYSDPAYFSQLFERHTGCTPSEFRKSRNLSNNSPNDEHGKIAR